MKPRSLKSIKYGAVVLVGFSSIVAFIVVSGVINAQPTTNVFEGWVTVLQPSSDIGPNQVQLRLRAVDAGGPGQNPVLEYSVLTCGDKPFRGVMVIGGDARISKAVIQDSRGIVTDEAGWAGNSALVDVPDLALGDANGDSWELGSVQLVDLKMDSVPPCLPAGSPNDPLSVATGYVVAGVAGAPVGRKATFLGLQGPRSGQSWPMAGAFPGLPIELKGEFTGVRGLSGSWIIPTVLHNQVSAGGLSPRATVDLSQPAPADNLSLTWNSLQPLRPSARLTNIDSMAIWQQWLVAAGIGFGIGGSLLASLLFEWARWRPSTSASGVLLVKPSVERSVFVPTEAASRAKTECPWVVTVMILFVAAILNILRRMISGRMGG